MCLLSRIRNIASIILCSAIISPLAASVSLVFFQSVLPVRAYAQDGNIAISDIRDLQSSADMRLAEPSEPSTDLSVFARTERQKIVDLSAGVFAYAGVLKHAQGEALRRLPFFRDQGLSSREETFLKNGSYVMDAHALSEALNSDLNDLSHGRYVFLRSQTLEAVGRFGLKTMSFLELDKSKNLSNVTRGALTRIGGVQDLVTALSQTVGSRRLDVDITNRYVDGIKALAQVELYSRGKLTSRFALIDGFQELATAGYKHHQQKRLDVDLVTQYLDAANNLAWTGLGMTTCGGNYACTYAVQTFGTTTARALRGSTEGLFKRFELAIRGQGTMVIDQWLSTQQRNLALGQPVQKISDVFGVGLLKQNGLSDGQIQELDDSVVTANARLPDIRNGIDLKFDEPIVTQSDLRGLTNAVLSARGGAKELTSDVE